MRARSFFALIPVSVDSSSNVRRSPKRSTVVDHAFFLQPHETMSPWRRLLATASNSREQSGHRQRHRRIFPPVLRVTKRSETPSTNPSLNVLPVRSSALARRISRTTQPHERTLPEAIEP